MEAALLGKWARESSIRANFQQCFYIYSNYIGAYLTSIIEFFYFKGEISKIHSRWLKGFLKC